MRKKQIIIIISIACAVAIIIATILGIALKNNNTTPNKPTTNEEKTQEELKKEFNNLFNNSVEFNDYETSRIPKLVENKPIVYTTYELEAKKEDKYEVDMHIPVINIKNTAGSNFNKITQTIFANKAMEILKDAKVYTIYSITYTGYINGDILSVIIKSTLKEGTSAQRIIVQTYNYNLATGEEITFEEILKQKQIDVNEVSKKINTEITKSIKEANKVQISGYQTYTRDLNDDIYKITNISTFFIGQDGKIRIVFAYGNNNFTSEMDIIEI